MMLGKRFFHFNPLVAVISFFLLILGGFLIFTMAKSSEYTVTLGGKTFAVEVADTVSKRVTGLSGHTPLGESEGMLFIFNEEGEQGIWMKDMRFPLDILWLDKNLVITHIEKSVSPDTYPQVYYPNRPSMYVLEISAGQSSYLDLKVGDTAKFTLVSQHI